MTLYLWDSLELAAKLYIYILIDRYVYIYIYIYIDRKIDTKIDRYIYIYIYRYIYISRFHHYLMNRILLNQICIRVLNVNQIEINIFIY